MVRIVRECCTHMPADTLEKLEARRDIGSRLGGDWEALALAVVRVDAGRRAGTIQHIRQTVGFLLTVAGSIRGKEPPTEGERATLRAMLDGTYKPPLRPGPTFYRAAPDEVIPLPSEQRMTPHQRTMAAHRAIANAPLPSGGKSQGPTLTPAPDDLTKIYHPSKVARWAAEGRLTPHQAKMAALRAIANAPLTEEEIRERREREEVQESALSTT